MRIFTTKIGNEEERVYGRGDGLSSPASSSYILKRMWWSACDKVECKIIMELKGDNMGKQNRLICPATGEREATIY
jgi:hypothetical protein